MTWKFAEKSRKFRLKRNFFEKPRKAKKFVEIRLRYFCTILYNTYITYNAYVTTNITNKTIVTYTTITSTTNITDTLPTQLIILLFVYLTFSRRDNNSGLSESFLTLSKILFLAPLVTPCKRKEPIIKGALSRYLATL